MTLIFSNSGLKRYFTRGIYAACEQVNLVSTPFESVSDDLLAWLGTQVNEGEAVSQVVIEDGGKVDTTEKVKGEEPDPDAVQTFRQSLNAAVSVTAQEGQRTFAISSETLPNDLRDGLIAAWEYISNGQ
jgi:hypothetical protein